MSGYAAWIWGLPICWPSSSHEREAARRRRKRQALAEYSSRPSNSPLIPMLCEVCRKRPVATIVVDFIFACSFCAGKSAEPSLDTEESPELMGSKINLTVVGGNVDTKVLQISRGGASGPPRSSQDIHVRHPFVELAAALAHAQKVGKVLFKISSVRVNQPKGETWSRRT
jgi:hypothetical protein